MESTWLDFAPLESEYIQDQINACLIFTEAKMVIKGVSTLTQSMKQFFGPDDFIANTTHPNPMRIVSIDDRGEYLASKFLLLTHYLFFLLIS